MDKLVVDVGQTADGKRRRVDAIGGSLHIEDEGQAIIDGNPEAQKKVKEWEGKWKDKMLEAEAAGQLTPREIKLAAALRANETPKEKKVREKKAATFTAASSSSKDHAGVPAQVKEKITLYIEGRHQPADLDKATVIVVKDLADVSTTLKTCAILKGLRLCIPQWVKDPETSPSIKYEDVTKRKLGVFFSDGFRAKYPSVYPIISNHCVGLDTGIANYHLKSWKQGWRQWQTFDAWQKFHTARKTQAMAIFTTAEITKKRENKEDMQGCYTFTEFLEKVAVVAKATRGNHQARAPRPKAQ